MKININFRKLIDYGFNLLKVALIVCAFTAGLTLLMGMDFHWKNFILTTAVYLLSSLFLEQGEATAAEVNSSQTTE